MFVVPGRATVQQGSRWDTRRHDGARVQFTDWCGYRDIVVWLVPPSPVQLAYLRGHGRQSYVLYDPHELWVSNTLNAYRQADAVLALNRSSGERCAADPSIRKAVYLPLAPGSPTYKKSVTAGLPVVLWPLFDGDWARFDHKDLIPRMSAFLEATAGTHSLRIVLSSNTIPAHIVREFQIWNRRYSFVSLQTCRNVLWRDLQYQGADVMFWPSTVENAMLRCLHAYNHGIPVVGVMVDAAAELLAANPQLAVAATKAHCGRQGYAEGISSGIIHPAMLSRLASAVQSPGMLAEATENVTRFTSARQRLFNMAMTKLFK